MRILVWSAGGAESLGPLENMVQRPQVESVVPLIGRMTGPLVILDQSQLAILDLNATKFCIQRRWCWERVPWICLICITCEYTIVVL